MTLLKGLCYLIGAAQLILGAIYLFIPQQFIAWQGLSEIGSDINYPLAMLAARFVVYGIGMFVIAADPVKNRFWLFGMIAIQAIDLIAGIYYTMNGVVAFKDSAIPMINAAIFMVGLILLRGSATAQRNS